MSIDFTAFITVRPTIIDMSTVTQFHVGHDYYNTAVVEIMFVVKQLRVVFVTIKTKLKFNRHRLPCYTEHELVVSRRQMVQRGMISVRRYLKSVFPVVDETVILDTLCSSENNVHKASETLMTMGFMKKADLPFKCNLKKNENVSYSSEKELKHDSVYIPLHDPSPKIRSYEEKTKSNYFPV